MSFTYRQVARHPPNFLNFLAQKPTIPWMRLSKWLQDLCDITFLSDEKLFARIPDHELAALRSSFLRKAVHEPCNEFESLICPRDTGTLGSLKESKIVPGTLRPELIAVSLTLSNIGFSYFMSSNDSALLSDEKKKNTQKITELKSL